MFSCCALLLTGCGIGATPAAMEPTAIGPLMGNVHGGQQPVSGANVQLYAAGTSGYGSAARPLVNCAGAPDSNRVHTAPCAGVSTDAAGSFTITGDYTCPPGAYVYIVAKGGVPGGSNVNSALALMTGLGACSSLTSSTFISINEVTTVATVFALQQFMVATYGTAGAESIGTSSTNLTGLQNAFASIPLLVNTSTGQAPASSAVKGTVNTTAVTVNVINENAKLNTLADILAYCVNSNDTSSISSACVNLFAAVQPAGQANAPADTIQATLDLALNPGNVGTSSSGPAQYLSADLPFLPNLGSSLPNDWTLGVSYYSPTATKYPSGTGTSSGFLLNGYGLTVDANGNVWVLNAASVSELGPGGVPLAQIFNGSLSAARGIAFDTSGNLYVTNSGSAGAGAIMKYAGGAITSYTAPSGYTGLYGIAADGLDNVFSVSGTGISALLELPANSSSGAILSVVQPVGAAAYTLAVDPAYNVWVTSTTAVDATEALATCTGTPVSSCSYPSTALTYTGGPSGMFRPFGIGFDSAGIPWIANSVVGTSGNYLTQLTPGVTSAGMATAVGAGGLNNPQYLAVDGANHIWAPNNGVTANTGSSVSEFDDTGAAISSNGYVHNFSGPRGIAIDASGNVWVSDLAGGQNSTGSSVVVTEVIGAAAPAVTPLALAVKNHAFGVRP
ncbi:hypothetical protein [Granulicella rosea]|nr:hypothetical protein [Granulicella rosea]